MYSINDKVGNIPCTMTVCIAHVGISTLQTTKDPTEKLLNGVLTWWTTILLLQGAWSLLRLR